MIRIVGIQRHETPEQEFVLLQNQGGLRVNLRGHMLLSECAVQSGDLTRAVHIFNDEALIPAGMYVILFSGPGQPRWGKTKDGALIYFAYMNRNSTVWERISGALHVLSTHHTYTLERSAALVLK